MVVLWSESNARLCLGSCVAIDKTVLTVNRKEMKTRRPSYRMRIRSPSVIEGNSIKWQYNPLGYACNKNLVICYRIRTNRFNRPYRELDLSRISLRQERL